MIISRTPFRISFFGGGTDYPAWFLENGGAVLATAIDKFCYITCRYLPPFFEHKWRIIYSQLEHVSELEEIRHPSVRETLKYLGINRGLEIHHDGDLPARSGMGSSSSFTVGLLNAVYALTGCRPDPAQLAKDAICIEQERIKECVGCQDQVMAAFGGLNHIRFHKDGFHVDPVELKPERLKELEGRLMLFFSGISRTASHIACEQVREIPAKKSELKAMHGMVGDAMEILKSGSDIDDFGRLLHESWLLKRSLTGKVSSLYIDYIYDTAKNCGALGGKLLGAGGGGFLLLYARPELQDKVRSSLSGLLEVPFRFESSGSQIIYEG